MIKILTVENQAYNLNDIPDEVEDLQYCILDCSTKDPDYFFIPLIFLEKFSSPAVVLEIKGKTIQMPMDWSILACEPDLGRADVIPLTSLNTRGFETLLFNPISSYMPNYAEPKILNVFQEVNWHVPKLKNGHLLAIPIEDGDKPRCVFFCKEYNHVFDNIDLGSLI